MGWNDEYILKFFMTPEGSATFGTSWGYLVKHHDQNALDFTQNFLRASRFRDREAAERCVNAAEENYPQFAAHFSSVEYTTVRE